MKSILVFRDRAVYIWRSQRGKRSPRLFCSPGERRARESRGRTSRGRPSWRETSPSSSPARPSGAVRQAAASPWSPSLSPFVYKIQTPFLTTRSAKKKRKKKKEKKEKKVNVEQTRKQVILIVLRILFGLITSIMLAIVSA